MLPSTTHGAFMDAIYWLPKLLITATGFAGKGGKPQPDPHEVYAQFFGLVIEFLKKHT